MMRSLYRFALAVTAFVTSCSSGTTSLTGKDAAIFNANKALSEGKCDTAIAEIDPYYHSSLSDNSVRRVRAAAYSCAANMGFFSTIDGLTTNNIVGSALWRTITKLFPSTTSDRRMEASWIATETLMTWLKPNIIIPSEYATPTGVYNPGSFYPQDRDNNANTMMAFTSMALIGATQSRYGKDASASFDDTYNKQKLLPWTTSTLISQDTTGCAYAGGIMNMFDSFAQIAQFADASLASSINEINLLKEFYDKACNYSCRGLTAVDPDNDLLTDFSVSGCTMTEAEADMFCSVCPAKLRHRSFCYDTNFAIDKNPTACAAAGLVILMNDNPALGWPGP